MIGKWWNAKARRTESESLLHRVQQLEHKLRRDGGRLVQSVPVLGDFGSRSYFGTEDGAVDRNDLDEVVATYDPLDWRVLASQRELVERQRTRVPSSVNRLLEKAEIARWGDLPMVKASGVGWEDLLTPRRVLVADGTQISNTTSETIICPDFTFAADYFEHGDVYKYTLLFDHSTVITTPGTHTFRLRYGGVAGTSMAASGAFAPDPTAASTTVTEMLEFWFVVRSTGTAGTIFCIGRYTPNDFDDASAAAIVGNLNMLMIPVSAPAVTSSLDTTAAKAISPTYTSSVNTATTQLTNHIALLESLN